MRKVILALLAIITLNVANAQTTKPQVKKTTKKAVTSKNIQTKSAVTTTKAATEPTSTKVETKMVSTPAVVAPTNTITDPNQPKPSNAKIEFVGGDSHNFGDVPEAGQIEHVFKFKNTGIEPLVLSDVRASCGCTTPSWPKEPVMPGETKDIKVQYNTAGRPGNFNKTITITSNATEPTTRLTITGNVIKAETGGTPEKPKTMVEEK